MAAWFYTPLAFIIPYALAMVLPAMIGVIGSGWTAVIIIAIAGILYAVSTMKHKYFIAACLAGSLFLKIAFDMLQSQSMGETIWMAMFAAFFFLAVFFSIASMATAE